MKTLFIIRGLPGSGKSTLGNLIANGYCFAADDFFYDEDGSYNFDPTMLKDAHEVCKIHVTCAMTFGIEKIAVCNTFTTEWEIRPYLDLAKQYDYTVFQIIVENTHGNKSIHNVPEETIDKMRKRFKVNL